MGDGPEGGEMRGASGWRERRGQQRRRAVAASILGAMLIGGYFAASTGSVGSPPSEYLISAMVLALAFWFPAMRTGSVGQLARSWKPLGVWLLAWTLVWDLATSGLVGERSLLEEWWIVYPAGVLVLGGLLALYAAVVARVGTGEPAGPGAPRGGGD